VNVIGTVGYIVAGPSDVDRVKATLGGVVAADNGAILRMTALHLNTKCAYNKTIQVSAVADGPARRNRTVDRA